MYLILCYYMEILSKHLLFHLVVHKNLRNRLSARNTWQNKKQEEILDPHLKCCMQVQSNNSNSFLIKTCKHRITVWICLLFIVWFIPLVLAYVFADATQLTPGGEKWGKTEWHRNPPRVCLSQLGKWLRHQVSLRNSPFIEVNRWPANTQSK